MPTTLVRGANSYFVNDEDADAFAKGAPGFQRTHVVADSGHSVQGDQPRRSSRSCAASWRLSAWSFGFRFG